eukprot:Colp12_sorted_trinity150504_noHs@34667
MSIILSTVVHTLRLAVALQRKQRELDQSLHSALGLLSQVVGVPHDNLVALSVTHHLRHSGVVHFQLLLLLVQGHKVVHAAEAETTTVLTFSIQGLELRLSSSVDDAGHVAQLLSGELAAQSRVETGGLEQMAVEDFGHVSEVLAAVTFTRSRGGSAGPVMLGGLGLTERGECLAEGAFSLLGGLSLEDLSGLSVLAVDLDAGLGDVELGLVDSANLPLGVDLKAVCGLPSADGKLSLDINPQMVGSLEEVVAETITNELDGLHIAAKVLGISEGIILEDADTDVGAEAECLAELEGVHAIAGVDESIGVVDGADLEVVIKTQLVVVVVVVAHVLCVD